MKNNPVQRIKLMMSYDMNKTLNENLMDFPTINESEDEIEEQGATTLLKDLKAAKSVEDKIPALARFFKMSDDAAKLAYAKDLTTLTKDVEKAIANDVKGGFKGGGSALGPAAKEISKQQAIKEILSTNKQLTEREIIEIIERIKSVNKQKAAQMEAKAGLKSAAKDTKTVATDTKAVAGDVKATEAEIKATVTDASKAEAEAALNAGGAVKENGKIKSIIEANKSRLKGMSETAFSKFKAVRKAMAIKWLIGLGLVAAGGAYLWSRIFGGTTVPDGTNTIHPKCITDMLDDDGSSVILTKAGDPVVKVTKTGNEEYDNAGGLLFYTNGRVFTSDMKKRGTWKCKGGEVSVQEQSELSEQGNQISQEQMIDFVDTAVDDLDGYVAVYNLKSLKDILTKLKGKTYKGQSAMAAFMDYYKQDEGGDDFISDVNSVGIKTLGVEGIDLKKDVLALANASASGDSNTSTGVGGIDIVWDGQGAKTGGDGGKKTGGDGGKKTKRFVDCENQPLPHKFGCKSSKIAEVQNCLNVTSDGKFGPNTRAALKSHEYDTAQGLTQEIYDDVLANCNKRSTREPINTEPIKRAGLKLQPLATNIKAPTLPNIKAPEMSPNDFYRALVKAGYIDNVPEEGDGKRRVKYKGPDLDESQLQKLDSALSDMGYDRIKQLEDVKRYGSKYVYKLR